MKIIKILEAAKAGGQIKKWFCSILEQDSLSIGLQNSQLGGVYNPPNKKRSQSAHVLLELDNQKVVRNSLSRQEMNDSELFSKLKTLAIPEEKPPLFPEKNSLPEVKVFCPTVQSQVDGRAAPMLKLLQKIQTQVKPKTTLSGKAEAHATRLKVYHSDGWEANTESTSTSIYAYADGLWGFSKSSRTSLEENIIEQRSIILSDSIESIHKDLPAPKAGIPIVFSSSFAGSLVQKFIFSNLFAHRVALGLSCFSPETVEAKERFFSSNLNLHFEALRDFHSASFRLNSDGTVGQNLELISQGQLINTIADLKGAALLHCNPTPVPKATGLVWNAEKEETFEKLDTEFLFIDSALGLHGQDGTTGNFSLAIPNASFVSKGKIVGRCRGRIQGNFFDLLNLPVTTITYSMMDGQGLFLSEGVKFLPDP